MSYIHKPICANWTPAFYGVNTSLSIVTSEPVSTIASGA